MAKWYERTDLAETPADADTFMVSDVSDPTEAPQGTVKEVTYLNLLGSALAALRTATVYVSGGTDVSVADGGTGVSILPSGELITGAGTSSVTGTAIPAGGLAGLTALGLKANIFDVPVDGQLAIWTDETTIRGDTDIAWNNGWLTVRNVLITPAGAAGPASIKLPEDTDSGTMAIILTAPPVVTTGDKVVSFQDVAGTLYVSSGTDVPVADGGTGVSTLPSGELVTGAGTSPVTGTAIPAGGLAGLTALGLKADAANPVFTGTVTVPDGALAIADTSGLQTALDAKLPLAGGTLTGALTLGTGASIVGGDKVAAALEIKDVGETAPSASVGGAVTRSFADGAVQTLTLTSNVTSLTISNPPASGIAGTITFRINHGTGPFTWAHPSGVKWPNGTPPSMSSGASDISIVSYMTVDGGTLWDGAFWGADMS